MSNSQYAKLGCCAIRFTPKLGLFNIYMSTEKNISIKSRDQVDHTHHARSVSCLYMKVDGRRGPRCPQGEGEYHTLRPLDDAPLGGGRGCGDHHKFFLSGGKDLGQAQAVGGKK